MEFLAGAPGRVVTAIVNLTELREHPAALIAIQRQDRGEVLEDEDFALETRQQARIIRPCKSGRKGPRWRLGAGASLWTGALLRQRAGRARGAGVGEAMRPAVGAEHAGLGQGARVPAIGLHLPRARRVHGGEVRVGDDDLMAQRHETPRDPFAVGRGIDHDPSPGSIAKHGREARWLRPNPAFDQFTALGQDADLAFPLVDVDANMIHGWSLLPAALPAGVLLWGRVGHYVKREASRFIPSTPSKSYNETLQ